MAHQRVNAGDFSHSGQLRSLWESTASNTLGPASAANQLAPAMLNMPAQLAIIEGEYRLSGKGLTMIATLHAQTPVAGQANPSGWLNELYQDINLDQWQLSAGKKIVSWDVGYGFRPNDMVQQEQRRVLISATLTGRPLAMAEYFNADSAYSLVWVNPTQSATPVGSEEQAIAARTYQRIGGLDLHGFARYGERSGTSLGTAVAWVATEAIEMHASARYQRRSPTLSDQSNSLLSPSSPWKQRWRQHIGQALIGLSYTTIDRHSFFLESWFDGNALSSHEWRQWTQKNTQLVSLARQNPALNIPVAANLAWQNTAFSAANNVRQKNVYARWSWQSGAWQPALDFLWTPEDKGHVSTLSIAWQGDRWSINAGLRIFGGPSAAIYAQLPNARSAYVATNWAF